MSVRKLGAFGMVTVRNSRVVLAACVVASRSQRRARRLRRFRPNGYFSHADFASAKLSPSGDATRGTGACRRAPALAGRDGRRRPANRAVVTRIADLDIASFEWVNDKRLVFSVMDLQLGVWASSAAADCSASTWTASNYRVLAPTVKSLIQRGQFIYRCTRFSRVLYDGSDDVLVLSNERSERWEDMYRLNTRDGRKTLLTHLARGPDLLGRGS